jgi:predicted RNA-binding Zn ribbon-like protein
MVIITATLNGVTPPSWASHVEDKLAPMPLLRVQAFVDTLDRDLGTDVFARADNARVWLADAGLRAADAGLRAADAGLRAAGADHYGGPTDPAFADDLQLAIAARDSIRALIGRSTEGTPLTPGDLAPLEEILGRSQPRLDVTTDGRAMLGPALPTETLADGLLVLLLIIRDAQADGTWDRLKLCANPDCRWAFYDRSHSRRGAWCDMASCGNRLKNRNLRARRAQLS